MLDKIKAWLKRHEVDLKDAGVRALKTAVQAFLAVTPVSAVFEFDKVAIVAGLSAAGAALVSFVWNVLLDYVRDPEASEADYSM